MRALLYALPLLARASEPASNASSHSCVNFAAVDCDWTSTWACPGGAAGTAGFAADDGSIGYYCCCVSTHLSESAEIGFRQADDAAYAAALPTLEAAAHDAPRPPGLEAACAGQPSAAVTSATVTLPGGSISASTAQQQCDAAAVCVVPEGTTLVMDGSLDVGALVVRGQLVWDDSTQAADAQWLCAGYIAAERSGSLHVDVVNRRAFIYLKANELTHASLGVRALGGIGQASSVRIRGRPLRRTWSLLAEPAHAGDTSVALLHDASAMGWRAGDRLVVAPTQRASSGLADAANIASLGSYNTIRLDAPLASGYAAEYVGLGEGRGGVPMAAEVLNLDRSIVITGDALSHHAPCRAAFGALAFAGSPSCTVGLHVIQMFGGTMQVEHTRVERCGQRGVKGKYCLHWHAVGRCPLCTFHSNAIEHGHQRGIVVHGTHEASVRDNVLSDVRGAGLYVEDGNEMGNAISHNVVVCPWPREGPMRGCTVPGTDNAEADTSLNQAGLWALPAPNHYVGNRFSNSFNGLFIQSNFHGGNGRGFAEGLECTEHQGFGRVRFNTNHGHGRFGTYFLGPNFPRRLQQSIASDGHTNLSTCGGFTPDGLDAGMPFRVAGDGL